MTKEEQIAFDKKTTFKQATNVETRMIGLASKFSRGEMNPTEKRRYYRQVDKLKRLMTKIHKNGWYNDWLKVGKG